MPNFKRFVPLHSATKAIKRDAQKANEIIDDVETYIGMSNLCNLFLKLPDWLGELIEGGNNLDEEDNKIIQDLPERIKELKILVTKLRLAGVGFEEPDEFSNINQALKQAYPPQALSNLFKNTSPFLKHIKKPYGY